MCYIDDHLEATLEAFNKNLFNNEIVNIGNDKEITILELAKKIIQISNSESKIVFLDPLKEGDMTRRQPDISRMKTLLKRDFTDLDLGLSYFFK